MLWSKYPPTPPTHTRTHTQHPTPPRPVKSWLMENGHEAAAWELAQKRAKKADWEAAVRRALAPSN